MQSLLRAVSLFAVVGMILGFTLPYTSERTGGFVMSLIFSSMTLGWVMVDAKKRQVALGSFLPVAVLLLGPLGVLWYGIRSRRWFFWQPFGIFLLLLLSYLCPILLLEYSRQQMGVVSPPSHFR